MDPRTIDNLGVDVSTRYAKDQKLLDEKILQEAKNIPFQTEIDVSFPSFSSEFDLLFETAKRNPSWADFIPPSGYFEQKKRLFTFQSIPSLGSQDRKESQSKKILSQVQALALKKDKEERESQEKDEKKLWEEGRKLQKEEKEKKILIKLLDCIILLDKYIIDINSRRSQYQKG